MSCTAGNPLDLALSDSDAYELWLLSMDDDDWKSWRSEFGEDGQPLLLYKEDGGFVINDPFLAEMDAEARRGAGVA